jgi:hypothetical protein
MAGTLDTILMRDGIVECGGVALLQAVDECRPRIEAIFRARWRSACRRCAANNDYRTAPSIAEPFVPSAESCSICSRMVEKLEIGSSGWIRTHLRQGSGGQASNPPVNRLQVVYLVGFS